MSTTRCPGFVDEAAPAPDGSDKGEANVRLAAEGTARQWHLSPEHPHLFCGCGNESAVCHPGRCCRDDDWGQCANCGLPDPGPDALPESELSDPLFALAAPIEAATSEEGR